jgi:hypothetical protein
MQSSTCQCIVTITQVQEGNSWWFPTGVENPVCNNQSHTTVPNVVVQKPASGKFSNILTSVLLRLLC